MNSLVMIYNINFPISIPNSTELQLPRGLSKNKKERKGGLKLSINILSGGQKIRTQGKTQDTRKYEICAKIYRKCIE